MDETHTDIAGLIEALGGTTRAAEALGEKDPRVVDNWRRRGRMPSHRFLAHKDALERIGINADVRLWFRPDAP
jgi:hypothetical protein